MNIDFPVTFSVFGRDVLLHPVMETIGIFIGMRYYRVLKSRSPEKLPLLISMAVLIGATAGALIGSKLIGNLEKPGILFSEPFDFKRFWTNNTIVGGLAFRTDRYRTCQESCRPQRKHGRFNHISFDSGNDYRQNWLLFHRDL